jgi:DNA processing protein
MEQNREVFAIPGSIHNPLARGCHKLIREGAKLVETAQDILEEMASVIDLENSHQTEPVDGKNATITTKNPDKNSNNLTGKNSTPCKLDSGQQELLDHMGFDPVAIDQLVLRSGQNPAAIAAMLLILELQNYVSSNGGGTYSRLR